MYFDAKQTNYYVFNLKYIIDHSIKMNIIQCLTSEREMYYMMQHINMDCIHKNNKKPNSNQITAKKNRKQFLSSYLFVKVHKQMT